MHELGITAEILDIVIEQSRGQKVTKVVLEIGKLTAIFPDAVRFSFELCAEGTVAEGASLEIIEPPGRARCRACGLEFVLEQPFGPCGCGGVDLEWLSGTELTIKKMEVLECASPADVPIPTGPN
jgi:hydrogenase nickel incorporation protein HypA/HybF